MKKAFLWIGGILLFPIILFTIITVLLYLPPVQNWAVDKAAEIASEETGMKISVDHVALSFPLDLSIEGVTALSEQGDTIANIGRAVVDVRLLPLIDLNVIVDEMQIEQARINTLSMIPDLQVDGNIGLLSVKSRGISINDGMVELNDAKLADADLTIFLNDTAAVDTSTSVTPWRINLDNLDIERSRVNLHMPGDTMQVMAYMGRAAVNDANIDLLNGIYSVRKVEWRDGLADYNLTNIAPVAEGIDYNHISLSDINVAIDSIFFSAPTLALKISEAALKEKSGLSLTSLSGTVLMDSTSLQMPGLRMATPYSNIYAKAKVDLNVMDSIAPGQLDIDLNAALGKQDLMLFMADMPKSFRNKWPEWPLSIKGGIKGNMQRATIDDFEISLPSAFRAEARGTVGNVTDIDNLMAQLEMQAVTYNVGFATALADPKMMEGIRIPQNISMSGRLTANRQQYNADLMLREGHGYAKIKGKANLRTMAYDADVDIHNINIHHFMPRDSMYEVSAHLKANGQGTDPFNSKTHMTADAQLTHFRYGHISIDSINASAQLANNKLQADIIGCNQYIEGMISLNGNMLRNAVKADAGIDLQKIDLHAIGLYEDTLSVSVTGDIEVSSDMQQSHSLSADISKIILRDEESKYEPGRLGLLVNTRPDSTWVRMQTGDMIVKIDASGGYERLLAEATQLTDTMMSQIRNRIIDQQSLKRQLPTTRFYVKSGRNNPVVEFLKTAYNTEFRSLHIDMRTSAAKGINGNMRMYGINADSIRIDTVTLKMEDKGKGLSYQAQVTNNRRNPQFVFNAKLDGQIHERGAVAGLRFYDQDNRLGVRLGATADMEGDGIVVKLLPKRPTIGYKEFNLNDDNFIRFNRNLRIESKIDLIADDGTGMKVYTDDQDSTLFQDLTVSLYRIDLNQVTSVLPYVLPQIDGILGGDFHIVMDQQKNVSLATDMQIDNLAYEKSMVGNIGTEFVYMQREDSTHAIDGTLQLDGREIGTLVGEYRDKGEGYIDAAVQLNKLPMMIVNGFVPDQLIGLEGFAEGEVKVKGAMSRPVVNGELMVSSAALISKPYGVRLRIDDDPVRIENSKIMLKDFDLYAHNDNPLTINGSIDFSRLDRMRVDMEMRASNFQLINSKQTKESIAYGKAFVNFFATLNGRMEQLRMRGKLDVLGSTDVTYLLIDSPLSADNRIDELVKFTDFSDSTQTVVQKPTPEGLKVDMSINIEEGTHVLCGLDINQTNYVDLFGGGNLTMKYDNGDITLNGRYAMNSGEMKYSLPVIPLKTFTIHDGSYVEFTGPMMNPRLNITATENTKAQVESGVEGEPARTVMFDCGVIITKTLEDMGLEFTLDAPEDMSLSSELRAMSKEQRGKLAVAMLTTGLYMGGTGNAGNQLSLNTALNSFLQGEINSIAGSALRTLDMSFGMNNNTDATGEQYTDYSFKFAKRFWNNRLKVQIGGTVSTGEEVPGEKKSFFDNVSMEYRLTPTGNQYVKLFYNQNVYDWLDGYTSLYGGGYIWRRKFGHILDIFRIWGNRKKQNEEFFKTEKANVSDEKNK